MTSSDAPATPPTAPPATPAKTRLSVRAIAAVVCLVLGLGLLPLGMLTYWGHRTVTDSERYIETMSPLAYDAEVQDSLAVFLTDKIEEQIDAEAIVAQIFGDLLAERPALNALVPVVTGAIAGKASGLDGGHKADLEIARNKERVMQLSNHLDICFESSADDKTLASPFCCTLVTYDEAQGSKAVPVIEENRRVVVANNSDEFYHAVDVELRRWFGKRVLGDERGLRRVVTVYMKPYPGDGVWDRLQAMVQEHGGTPTRTDGPLAIRQAEPLQ